MTDIKLYDIPSMLTKAQIDILRRYKLYNASFVIFLFASYFIIQN